MQKKYFKRTKLALLVTLLLANFASAQTIIGDNVSLNGNLLNGSISKSQIDNASITLPSDSSSSKLTINNESLSLQNILFRGSSDYSSSLVLENYAVLNIVGSGDWFVSSPAVSFISINSGSVLNVNNKLLLGGEESGTKSVVLTVSGNGSALNVATELWVGNAGGTYSLIAEDGATISADGLKMRGLWKNSSFIAKGSGTEVTDRGVTEVSSSGLMSILDGAIVNSRAGLVSSSGVSDAAPYVLVSGVGSTWNVTNDLEISHQRGNNASLVSVEDGGLIKAGTINASASSRLTGNGTFESTNGLNLNSGAIIDPGYNSTSHKTLSIIGDLNFFSGSIYNVSGDAYSNDRINVTGTANLTGGVVNVVADGTTILANTRYTILSASGSLGGTEFDDVKTNYAFLGSLLHYDTNNVYFELFRNTVDYSDYALTPNQKSTAIALKSVDRQGLLDDYVDTLSEAEVANAFDLLSGEIHSTLRSSLLNWSNTAGQLSFNHIRESLMSSDSCKYNEKQNNLQKCTDNKKLVGWAELIGSWRQTSTDGNAAKSKANTSGLLIGANYKNAANDWSLGTMFGYGITDDKSKPRRSSAKLHNYTLGLNAGKRFNWGKEHINVMGGLSYTHHSIKTDRTIPRVDQILKAKYSGNTIQAFGEVGYVMDPMGKWLLEPFVGLNVAKQKVGSFEETGGFAGVHSKAESKTYTTAILGLHTQSDIEISGKPLKVRGTAALKQAIGNKEVTRTMAFNVGSHDYLIWGVPRSSSTLVLGVQGQMALSPTTTFEAGFNGEFGSKVREQSIQARVRWAF